MRAVILAGGKGTRLYPYTATLPKPLVPIGDRAILEIVVQQLQHYGVTHVTMAVSHLAHLIKSYFGDGKRLGVKITYSVEERTLSTIAPLKLIKDLPDTFYTLNGDVLTDLDFAALYSYHLENKADITVACFDRDSKIDFGVIESDRENRIVGFVEKPVYHFSVSMGIYVINRELLDIVPDNTPFGFDNLMLACIKHKRRAICYRHSGQWLDIGRPDDYSNAQENIHKLMKGIGFID